MNRPFIRVTIMIALFLFAFLYAQFQGGFVSWFLFYAFLPIALYSMLQYFFAFRGMMFLRFLDKQKCSVGEKVRVTVVAYNHYYLPYLYVQFKDFIPEDLQAKVTREHNTVYPGFKKESIFQYELDGLARGSYRWQYGMMLTSDLFGLIRHEKIWSQPSALIVFPKIQNIQHWSMISGENTGVNVARSKTNLDEASLVIGARDYAPGDRLSRIHWKSSARTGQLKSKEFEYQVTHDFMLFVDREEASYGNSSSSLFERAVSLAASLSSFGIKRSFACGLISCGPQNVKLPMKKDSHHFSRLLEHMAVIQADASYPFAKMVVEEVLHVPYGTTVVLITPRLDQHMLQCVDYLRQQQRNIQYFWVVDEGQDLSKQQQMDVQFLIASKVDLYIVDQDRFNDILAKGGKHVSA